MSMPGAASAAATQGARGRLLIVEDEAIVARDLQGRLKRLGYEVCGIAASGAAAIEAASLHRPDLVLMDIVLKGDMDGVEAAEVISRDYQIPIVFLTAYADQQTLQRAKLTFPLGYIVKPFTERELGIMLEINLYRAEAESKLRQSIEALRLSEARFRAVIDTAKEGIVLVDSEGRIQMLNPTARLMFGWGDEAIGESVGRLIPVGDRDAEGESAGRFAAAFARYCGVGREVEGRRKDGATFPLDLTVGETSQLGQLVFVGVARDITERKRAETTQRILIDELNHRVKNTLAMVQAFASQTLSATQDPGQFVESFSGRVQALASIHTLLTQTAWGGTDIASLVRAQLAFSRQQLDDVLSCAGPAVSISPQLAVHLSLALHELCVNAIKYGALSVPDGRVNVSWAVNDDGADSQLTLNWLESGGPPVTPPTRRGFGSALVERGLAHIGGAAKLDFPATGVTCTIALPLTIDDAGDVT